MPGNVRNAAPVDTMPDNLSQAYTVSSRYLVPRNEYADGETQRRAQVATGRLRWRVTRRLAPADLDGLQDFFNAHMGAEFYFLDKDSVQRTVRYESGFGYTGGMGRSDTDFSLVEVN